MRPPLFPALALLGALAGPADAVVPMGRVSLSVPSGSPQFGDLLCAPSGVSGWGVALPEQHNSRWKHVLSLPDAEPANGEGCEPYMLPDTMDMAAVTTGRHSHGHRSHGHDGPTSAAAVLTANLSTLVLADRGNCSFLQKALNAQAAGARGLVVRGTKKAVYEAIASHNTTNLSDAAALAKPAFEFDCSRGEAFVAQLDDPVWRTDAVSCSSSARCSSGMCVLTGATQAAATGGQEHQVCCMWDTYVLMGVGNRSQAANVTIPVVYMTVRDGQQLSRALASYPDLLMRTFRRDVPLLDVSSMLLWALGVATAIGASYYSAAPSRRAWRRRMRVPTALEEGEDQEVQRQARSRRQDMRRRGSSTDSEPEEIWELDTRHAVGFIVFAGVFLTVLYYVKIGGLVPVLFCVSGAAALTQLIAAPALNAFVPAIASRQLSLPLVDEPVALAELLGIVPTAALALGWYFNRRTWWPVQDLMGIALSFLFLRTVQIPNLRVATILLSLAFCYDVFFVFISPAVFGSSVMEDVATGGPAAYTRSDYPGVDYCERYPKYPVCLDPEPMPMLLVLPRVFTWLKGVSMLGLGDIILPGMVLSLALRFDYAPKSLGENYFRKLCIGYAVGLGMANVAVTLMAMGQPALMYLVPTTLGTLLVSSRRNGDFRSMWSGVGLQDDDDDYDGDSTIDSEARAKERTLDGEAADAEQRGFTSAPSQSQQQQQRGLRNTSAANRGDRSTAANDSVASSDHAPLLGGGSSSI